MKIDDLFWHDGIINSYSCDMDEHGNSDFIIRAHLYKNADSTQRQAITITCPNIEACQVSLNIKELKDNLFAGNISNGYLKGNKLWVYFTDGIFEITGEHFEVNEF